MKNVSTLPTRVSLLDLNSRERRDILKRNRGLIAAAHRRLLDKGVSRTLGYVARVYRGNRFSAAVVQAIEEELAEIMAERTHVNKARQEADQERRSRARAAVDLLTARKTA